MTGNMVFLGFAIVNIEGHWVPVVLALSTGAIVGGLLVLHARSYAPALPLAISVLVILAGRTMHRAPRRQIR
jgi:uncharacterized membrane protein YoaK (UPF0700 family)